MRRDVAWIADFQLARRAGQHVEHTFGDVLLQTKQPQRRAALTGGAERRRDRVVDDLFGQRGGIRDHDIDAAGFGDQRHDWSVLGGERAIDRAAHRGRAGKDHAGNARIGNQHGPDRAFAGHEMQRARRHARLVQKRDRERGDERRLFGGLR
jgi:hypothetical protein